MALGSIDGLVSGIDTSSVISQLMSLERQPQTRLRARRASVQTRVKAYQAINAKLESLRSIADTAGRRETWQASKATSSSTSVKASASTAALPGTFTFDVTSVAKAQAYGSGTTYASTAARITTATSFTITKGSAAPVTVSTGDGSLGAVVSAINAAAAGVTAAAVQVAPGQYRLSLTSTTTGAASDFVVADGVNPAPLGVLAELVAGTDAVIEVGEVGAPGRYSVTSASNTFADVMPGVSVTVSKVESSVRVDVALDVDAIASQVAGLVAAANAALEEMEKQTAYDPATRSGSVLAGDSIVRGLQQRILNAVTTSMGGGSLASVGIEVTRNGRLELDRAALEAAIRADAPAVAAKFRAGGTTAHPTPARAALARTLAFMSADDRTEPGAYRVVVTQAATRASSTLTGAVAGSEDVTITVPGKAAVHVLAQLGDTQAAFASRINEAAAANALGVVASVEGGAIVVRSVAYGSAPTLTLASSGGTLAAGATTAGSDVQGTIGGVSSTGVGQLLTADPEHPTLRGLAVVVSATVAEVADAATQAGADAGLLGVFTYTPGIAQRLDSLAGGAVRSGTGRLAVAIDGSEDRIADLDDQIEAWDTRLALREALIRRQFTALETALGNMRNQSNWLAGQLAGLTGGAS